MNKIYTYLILIITISNASELTKSCKDYNHQECLRDGWHFDDADKRDALEFYSKSLQDYNNQDFISAYKNIIKARDIEPQEQIINSNMTKRALSGSSIRPKIKMYQTKIKNTYDIQKIENNIASQITAQPIVIVECLANSKKKTYKKNIYVHNVDKSFKSTKKIENMDLSDIDISINDKKYHIANIPSGESKKATSKNSQCQDLDIRLDANNMMFDRKSINKITLQ